MKSRRGLVTKEGRGTRIGDRRTVELGVEKCLLNSPGGGKWRRRRMFWRKRKS